MSDDRQGPEIMKCEPGIYAWCRCGKSAAGALCDGAHAGTAERPMIVKLEDEKTVAWCRCGKTASAPYCDGSHS